MAADVSTIERGVAEVNGTRLYYEVCGFGPALLFMHGYTLDHRMWSRQVQGLSSRFRTVVYDVRGFGRSATPVGQTYRHCDDAAALCEHLGIERVVAIGHSIGGYQALEFAIDKPALVAGYVAVCVSAPNLVPLTSDLKQMFAAMRKAAREQSIEAAKQIWRNARWFHSAREQSALTLELDQILADYSGWDWTHDNPVKHLVPSVSQRLDELDVPALIITGDRDHPHNHSVAGLLLQSLPNAKALRLPRAGHMANMEDPAAVNRAIADFARGTGI